MNKENKKHYLIYQITNLINGKIYIGKHITENIEDNYFGSGKYLRRAIQKHGLENFEFKILMDLSNEEEMNLLEKCIVTEEFCKRKDTYNIMEGGSGGWDYVNTTGKNMGGNWKNITYNSKKFYEKHGYYPKSGWIERIKENEPEKYKQYCQNLSKACKKYYEENGSW